MNTKTLQSRQPGKSAKSTPTSVEQTEPGSASDGATNHLVRIHDLMGRTAIRIPAELRAILGDEAYERNLEELNYYEITMIVREPTDVIYLRMPVLAVSFEPSHPSSQEPGEASKPKAKPKAKPQAKPKAKPKAKNLKRAAKPAA